MTAHWTLGFVASWEQGSQKVLEAYYGSEQFGDPLAVVAFASFALASLALASFAPATFALVACVALAEFVA